MRHDSVDIPLFRLAPLSLHNFRLHLLNSIQTTASGVHWVFWRALSQLINAIYWISNENDENCIFLTVADRKGYLKMRIKCLWVPVINSSISIASLWWLFYCFFFSVFLLVRQFTIFTDHLAFILYFHN